MKLADFPPWLVVAYAVALGLLLGSFLNVVIHRVPRGMSVVRPSSRCPRCGTPIAFYDNVPVISYLLLRGRARCCRATISPRYFLVEALGGALAWAIVQGIVLRLPPDTGIGRAAAVFASDLGLALSLVAVAFIDLEHMYVPDAVSLGGTVAGVLTSSLRDRSFLDSILGAGVGFVLIWLPFCVGYRLLRGRTGMGLGDAKLVMLAGAWFGWQGAVFALLAGAVQGTIAALVVLLVHGKLEEPAAIRAEKQQAFREIELCDEDERRAALEALSADPVYEPTGEGFAQARIAFGPFLALAMLEYMLIAGEWVTVSLRWISLPG